MKREWGRRDFFKLSLLSLMPLVLPLPRVWAKGTGAEAKYYFTIRGAKASYFCAATPDMSSWQSIRLPLDFIPHSVEKVGEERYLICEKWRKEICLINGAKNQIEGVIRFEDSFQFVGHGLAYEGKIYVSASDYSEGVGRGKLMIYDQRNLQELGRVDLGGFESHQLFRIGERIYVLNAAMAEDGRRVGRANIAIVDARTHKLLENAWCDENDHFAHGQVVGDEAILLIGGKALPGSAYIDGHCRCEASLFNVKTLKFMPFEPVLTDYHHLTFLSVDTSPGSDLAYITAPSGNCVLVYNLKDGSLVKEVPVGGPSCLSVSSDGEQVYVGADSRGEIIIFNKYMDREIKRIGLFAKAGAHSLFS